MPNTESSPTYTHRFWAKSEPRQGHPKRIHFLEHHLADVGACFEALMRQPTVRKRLATTGGLDDLDEVIVARLSALAALHDIGKVNVGFQAQIWRPEDLPAAEKRLPRRAGHTAGLVPVLTGEDGATVDWFFATLGWDNLLTWDDRGGETVCALFVATLSHHGRPLQLEGGLGKNPAVWRPFGDWFPSASVADAPPLPSAPAFQHMFLGLCNWADWIGSDERYFKYCDRPQDDYIETARKRAKQAVDAIGLDLSTQRHGFNGVPKFGDLFEPGVDAGGTGIPHYNPWWEDGHGGDKPWAGENPKRFLAAQVAVGTVDQAMMGALQIKNAHMRAVSLAGNLLVVDEVHASDTYMSVVLEALLEAHVGAGGYALLMSATLGSAARQRWMRHGRPSAGETPALDVAIAASYPAVSTAAGLAGTGENDREKNVRVEADPRMHDFADTAQWVLTAARAGAKVLVVRNTVAHAVSTQRALEELVGPEDTGRLFTVAGVRTLHHGRFPACDRALLDERIAELLGKGRQSGGLIIVGTQTLEQSLDIDADLLITDLCPVDVLLQRIGRLHRHRHNDSDRPSGYVEPTCIVLTPPDDNLAPLLRSGQGANGLGPYGGVYRSLSILEATRRLIAKHPKWRIPEMNRQLVEHATHPEALRKINKEMGESWQEHAQKNEGGEIADREHARGHTIRRDKSFFEDNQEVKFTGSEERIRTRLGDDRIDVAFDPPQPSPFDASNSIGKLAVSVRWLQGEDVPEHVAPSPINGGFEFSIGERRFWYDRLGLRRA